MELPPGNDQFYARPPLRWFLKEEGWVLQQLYMDQNDRPNREWRDVPRVSGE